MEPPTPRHGPRKARLLVSGSLPSRSRRFARFALIRVKNSRFALTFAEIRAFRVDSR